MADITTDHAITYTNLTAEGSICTYILIGSNDKPKKGFEPSQLNFAFSFYLPKTETCA